MTKNVLCLAHICPLPCIDGGKMGVFYPLKNLASFFNISFSAPVETINNEIIENFKTYNIKFYPYKLNIKDNYLKYPLSLVHRWSFKFNKYYNKCYLRYIEKIVKENNIEIIWVNAPHMAVYALSLKKKFPHLRLFLRQHNIEYDLVRQYSKSCKNIFMKAISYFEYLKTKNYETSLWNKFEKVFFISDSDLEIAKKYSDFTTDNLIYDGFEEFNITYNQNLEEKSFIFTGSMRSFQNVNNLQQFINDIWSHFIKIHPDCKLYLTGNTDEFLESRTGFSKKELNSINVFNLGFVDNIQETILSKKYVISPTYYGSGIRLKVLEAMGLGKVVFVPDIDYKMCRYFKDMENIVHYSDCKSFLSKYNKLEDETDIFERIGNNAKAVANDNFSWEKYAEKIKEEIDS